MDRVANLPARDRRDLFLETAARRSINAAVVEKDFWVCWVLQHLFADRVLGNHLVFKGGTSLSKVFGVIDRFSEDVDLVLDWRLLGYGAGLEDPYPPFESATKRDRFNKRFNERAAAYIADAFAPELVRLFAACPAVVATVDPEDPQAINVAYPASFSEAYMRPEVRLEIGPLASWIPSSQHAIRPYAAETFPDVFSEPDCEVRAISAERTFWEKTTILHQQAHRKSAMPARYSRHYYDLCRLASSPVRDSALSDFRLLADVVAFKQRFYPSKWAHYDTARPGTLRLIPTGARVAELRRDYREMTVMIFGDVPDFDAIIEALRGLDRDINR